MSEKHVVRFEVIAWTLSPVLAVILYVLAWPPVSILWVKRISLPLTSSKGTHSGILTVPHPWASTIYWPLDVLRAANGKGNILERYYEWWRVVLKK